MKKKMITRTLLAAMLCLSMAMNALAAGTSTDVQALTGEENIDVNISIDKTTVDVPMTDVDDPDTEEIENQNTVKGEEIGTTTVTGDVPESPEDEEYDYTVSTVTGQSSVTVTTTNISSIDTLDETDKEADMDYVSSDAIPDATNDIIKENVSAAPDEYLNGADTGSKPEEGGDYQYVYMGSGNTSQLRPAVVFTEPMTDEEKVEKWGESAYLTYSYYEKYAKYFLPEGVVVDKDNSVVVNGVKYAVDENGERIIRKEQSVVGPDGKTYYFHRLDRIGDGHKVEGWFQDGEWKADLNNKENERYGAVYAGAQQFVLVDKNTGEIITTYCADIETFTQDGFGYSIENLKDAEYYTEEQAKMIRSVALQGYWGTESGTGSLEEMRNNLLASGLFTAAELESLTDGVAMTATQMAIWSFSNHMSGAEFVNSHYFGDPSATETDGYGAGGNIPEDKEDEVKLMFKVYEYLKNLAPTETENTTADTVINAENFLKDMSVTVLEKAEDHENNQDEDDANDAYVTNLTFALVVTPASENGDDLVVRVLDSEGNVLACGRIAGEAKEGEELLVMDDNGNYTFTGITMTEGTQNFHITLEGVQNLEEGVYLYTSEVQDGVSSQTMVGIATGEHSVDVSMNISFELSVDDGVVVSERFENSVEPSDPPQTPNDPPQQPTRIPRRWQRTQLETVELEDEEVPMGETPEEDDLVVLLDEEVPLADAPETGDISGLYLLISAVSGSGLLGMTFTRKREETEE